MNVKIKTANILHTMGHYYMWYVYNMYLTKNNFVQNSIKHILMNL